LPTATIVGNYEKSRLEAGLLFRSRGEAEKALAAVDRVYALARGSIVLECLLQGRGARGERAGSPGIDGGQALDAEPTPTLVQHHGARGQRRYCSGRTDSSGCTGR